MLFFVAELQRPIHLADVIVRRLNSQRSFRADELEYVNIDEVITCRDVLIDVARRFCV